MKRQSEELFFQYKSAASNKGQSGINFDMPKEYEPLPGDIIEMIISEPDMFGAASYYAKLVFYKDIDGYVYVDALNGKLKGDNGVSGQLISAGYYNEGGKKTISLFANDGVIVLVTNQGNLVNMIVHRSKAEIELYSV